MRTSARPLLDFLGVSMKPRSCSCPLSALTAMVSTAQSRLGGIPNTSVGLHTLPLKVHPTVWPGASWHPAPMCGHEERLQESWCWRGTVTTLDDSLRSLPRLSWPVAGVKGEGSHASRHASLACCTRSITSPRKHGPAHTHPATMILNFNILHIHNKQV